ncbi:hypothetical protein BDZ91DRAFT_709104 [Kalaharituber pfeilii]|nr:hypothetical protein BDZ91DRAFT_709104 [Kalaharituber pfeilii]
MSMSASGKEKETFPKYRKQKTAPSSSPYPAEANTWCLFCLSCTFSQNKFLYRLFHPVNAIDMRTSYRPKHQSLVLKCYPALPKDSGAKPNPSELSYLLYYASTRRSKLQKVGKFLEKRTASDVWRAKPGNVHVTLEICKALIEKCPRDLNLYASSILTVLQTILGSKDINLIEDSIPCFESFCAHHDGANLSSDSEFVRQFEEIITLYAECASSFDKNQALKWRSIGLLAINSVASSEALSSAADARRQLSIIIPVILQNVYSESEDHLLILQQRTNNLDQEEAEGTIRPRLSLSTVATNITDAAAAAAASTAEAADKLEEEDIGVLALRSLKRIFEVNNTAQIRYATVSVLDFVTSKQGISEGWATALLEMIAKWAPVQYRHLILITCQDALVRIPMRETALPKQLIVAHLISWLLASSVNLIGLSVMDVLLSFINHILRLLQLEGSPRNSPVVDPLPEQDTTVPSIVLNGGNDAAVEISSSASDIRQELLVKLQFCIGNLGNHIYYSDQIADMVSEILVRLKPASPTPIAASNDPIVAASATGNLSEKQNTDDFFSFVTARTTALKCVKDILKVANNRTNTQSLNRNAVPLSVWEGTTWLLREEDRGVRKNYVDAFTTYLKLEIDRTTGSAGAVSPKKSALPALDKGSNNFLKLLHVAIYESALQYAPDSMDLVALHLLLTQLVLKLNLNAIVPGLPMIYKLQSEIPMVEDRKAQVGLSSLVAGYLLTVGELFGLQDVQEDVGMEIKRRKEHGQWFDGIRFPPQDIPPTPLSIQEKVGHISQEPIMPFDNRFVVVSDICDAALSASPEQRSPVFMKVKDALLVDWSKEAVLAELETHSSRQASITESRLGTGTLKHYLSVNDNNGGPGSLNGSSNYHNSRPGSKHGGAGSPFRVRLQTTGDSTTRSSSSRSWTVKVDDLKAVLTGQASDASNGGVVVDDSSSASEWGSGRFSLASSNGNGLHKKRSASMASRRGTIGSESGFHNSNHSEEALSRNIIDRNIPPVPRLPPTIPGTYPGEEEYLSGASKENGHSRLATSTPMDESSTPSIPVSPNGYKFSHHPSVHSQHGNDSLRPGTGKIDVQSFLSGIDAVSTTKKRPGSSRGVFKPPY